MTQDEPDQTDFAGADTNTPIPDPPPKPSRLRRRLIILAVVLAIGGIIALGEYRFSAGDATGTSLAGPALTQNQAQNPAQAVARDAITIATYNIHSGKGVDGKRDLQRTADTLEDFDLIGLQEVRDVLLDGKSDQAEQLGKSLGMQWLFAPTVRRWGTPVHGNGFLSKLKATRWERIELSGSVQEAKRNMLYVVLDWDGRPIHVLITHLSRTKVRDDQRAEVYDKFLALPKPAVLMGDLNTNPNHPSIKKIRQNPEVIDVRTLLTEKHQRRVRSDAIFLRGFKVVEVGTRLSKASDHRLLWSRVRLLD